MTDAPRAEAWKLLQDPRLMERILQEYEACGLVGEEDNKLIRYLACTSRPLLNRAHRGIVKFDFRFHREWRRAVYAVTAPGSPSRDRFSVLRDRKFPYAAAPLNAGCLPGCPTTNAAAPPGQVCIRDSEGEQ